MKILLIGEIYSDNLGDGIIYDNMKFALEGIIPEVDIIPYDLSLRTDFNIKDETIRKSLLKSALKKQFPKVFDNIKLKKELIQYRQGLSEYFKNENYDVAIFCGGQILSKHFIASIYALINKLELSNTPVYFYGVGIGDIHTEKQKRLLKKILTSKIVKQITVRDGLEKLNAIYPDIKITKCYDVALLSSKTYDINRIENSCIIGLGIMDVKGKEEEVLRFWEQLLFKLKNVENYTFELFTNGNIDDTRLANYIYEKDLKNYSNFRLAKRPTSTQELVQTISKFNRIISFRLHSHIISRALSIPSIALIWDNKVEEFFDFIGVKGNCFNFELDESIDEITHKIDGIEFSFQNAKDLEYLQSEIISSINSIIKDHI